MASWACAHTARFHSAPVIRLVAGIEPFEPERIAERRKSQGLSQTVNAARISRLIAFAPR